MAKRRTKAGTSKGSKAERVKLFIAAMLKNGGNATQAAVAAHYKPGKAAQQAGWRLSKDVEVRALLEKVHDAVLDESIADSKEVLRSATRDIRFDPAKMLDEKGNLKPLSQWDADTRLALRGMEVAEISAGQGENAMVIGHTKKVKFPEKTAAREQLMKHFGLYEVDNSQRAPKTVLIGQLTVQPEALSFEKVRARALKAA